MKMGTFLKILLVVAVAGSEATATNDTTTKPDDTTPAIRGSVKYSGPTKPFFYGRKFELSKDSKEKKDKLYSPLITTPIRALSTSVANLKQNSEPDAKTLKHNQNEIFLNIRDLFEETTKETFNKTYFAEEVSEEENHGGETTSKGVQNDGSYEANSSVSKPRQNGDRSLLVVLPFKAEGDNVEELFTKSPLIRVIENDEVDGKTGTTVIQSVTREIIPTTDPTRKRWRPFKRVKTTTESSSSKTTTENGEDATKTYTNYNDAEQVTKKFENLEYDLLKFTNHKLEEDSTTLYPVYKRLKNKTKQEEAQPEEKPITELSTKTKLKRKGQRRKSTTEGPPKPEELSKVLDILPPDMKDLILQIGLNKDNSNNQASENSFRLERPPQPTIDPMSYAVFKPLPLEGHNENRNFVPDDMKDFLASFGLLPVGRRVQKSLKPEAENKTKPFEDISNINFDFLPDDLKSLLEDMGLVKSPEKKEPTRIHIFNPSNHSIAKSEEDFEKLNAILSSIKTAVNESQKLTPEMQSNVIEKIRELNNLRYKSGNLSEINNEIKKIVVNRTSEDTKLKSTAKRATKLFDGPDPLMFSDESLLKNDVKRQDSTNTSFSSSSASSSASRDALTSASASASASASTSSSASSDASASASASSSASSDASASASASSSASSDVSAPALEGDAETTTTEEGPNIEALKESFGGGETASDDADIESSLPPRRPNGLYLLLDWNSFLEVGTEDDNRRVNLRFQPKIGDSRNFLPVSVP